MSIKTARMKAFPWLHVVGEHPAQSLQLSALRCVPLQAPPWEAAEEL